jgi:uncharacterized protein YndB with AHSA1/START domain
MTRLVYEVAIAARRATVFRLLADLRGYEIWLPHSSAFKGTVSISDGPIRLGTTYKETDGFGTRNGRVTEFVEPSLIGFEQPMTPKLAFLGHLDIRLRHELAEVPGGTRLVRTLELGFHGPVRLISRFVTASFDTEIHRMLQCLKIFAEAGNDASSSTPSPSREN